MPELTTTKPDQARLGGFRFGFDGRYINDQYHGIGRYAFRLIEALAISAPQHTFVVFRGKGNDSRFNWDELASYPNMEIWPGPWPLYAPQEQFAWPEILRRSQVNLLHTPYFVAPLLARTTILITVHDLIFDRYPAYMPMTWTRPYYRFLMATSLRKAGWVLTVSQATAGDLQKFYRTPAEKIVTIPEGVEPNFSPLAATDDRQLLRQRYGLDRPFILTVGARRPHKNMERLVQAYAALQSKYPHTLVFAGPADRRFPDLARRAADQCGLAGTTRFLDWVPEADLPGLYALADLVVLPSMIEGFGLPALEAMSCQTPVLAASGTSFTEVLGKTGMLFDPFDTQDLTRSLDRLLGDQPLRQSLAEAGRQRASSFTWQEAARRTLALYESVLK